MKVSAYSVERGTLSLAAACRYEFPEVGDSSTEELSDASRGRMMNTG